MSDSSSPFVESPRAMVHIGSPASAQYEIRSLSTEKQLALKANESLTAHYEKLLEQKNAAIHQLQDDFDFLYKDRNEMKSKLENQTQINESRSKELQQQNQVLLKQLNKLESDHSKETEKSQRLAMKLAKAQSDVEYLNTLNSQLDEKISSLESDNKQLLDNNDGLIKQLDSYSKSLTSDVNLKLTESLSHKNTNLQKINNELQSKLDRLLQERTSAELLKQKNLSLNNRISHLETIQESYSKLEIEHIRLQARFDQFFKIISSAIGETVDEEALVMFLDSYTHLQNSFLVLQDKFNTSQSKVNDLKTLNLELEYRIKNDLGDQITRLNSTIHEKDQAVEKLHRQNALGVKEIEFLRAALKRFERLNQKEVITKSTDEYLTNLERLVDDYKKEINVLQQQLSKTTQSDSNTNHKRPKLDDEYRRRSEIEHSNLQSENIKLSATVKDLNDKISVLESNLEKLNQVEQKSKDLHVLQLRSNPFTNDQLVKQQMLDVLRRENEDLMAKYVHAQAVDQVPKSIFERQELDKSQLAAKVDELNKRNKRLKEKFTKKAKDILSTISSFFGFSIEFIESSINHNELSTKIKLTSKYTFNNDNLKNSYIILDLNNKSLKAYGNFEFKTLCEELVNEWSNDKDQVACILSALNISLYKKFVVN